MSRHRLYRNYDYENDLDEFDGYEEEEEGEEEDALSPEDRAQMNAGTAEVRSMLGPQSSKVTKDQIEEALWHYYYDVDKTVAYLISKYIAPAEKKSAKSNNQTRKSNTGGVRHFSFADFFHDMPWMNIPKDRETTFIEPLHPRGGLLGGSGRMSKLQQLAQARKKKAEEQKHASAAQSTSQSAPQREPSQDKANVKPPWAATPSPPAQPVESAPNISQVDGPPPQVAKPDEASKEPELQQLSTAVPSAFARVLLGSAPTSSVVPAKGLYALPYMKYTMTIANAFSGPSPDDKVLAAQSKASNKTLANTAKKVAGTDQTADKLKTLKIDDSPLPKSKNLNVLKEYEKSKTKKSSSFVVVGHVDSGKSTMMGRLLLDLKVVDQRTIDKYRKEAEQLGRSSFALAWVTDSRPDERSHGVTIDVATNSFETDKTAFTILDAPGHRDYVPNMIAGAAQADFAILVVDASTGAFEAGLKGQTHEHCILLRSMGVFRLIVAINKLDTVSWSKDRFDEISEQVTGFLSKIHFNMKKVSFVPVSGLNGDNIVKKSSDPAAKWYSGPTLLDELENSDPLPRDLNRPLRMMIENLVDSDQSPVAVTGRIEAGTMQVGDPLLIQPSGERAFIKALERPSGDPVDWAVAGQHIVVHLARIEEDKIHAGNVLCPPKSPIKCVDSFTLKALTFEPVFPMPVELLRGRLYEAGKLREIPAILDPYKGTVTRKRPQVLRANTTARIVVTTEEKIPLETEQRVILRAEGRTVVAGKVE